MNRMAIALSFGLLCAAPMDGAEKTLRFGTGIVSPTSELEGFGFGGGSAGAIPLLVINVETDYRIEAQVAALFSIGYELALSERFGFEISAESLVTDLEARATHTVQATDYSAEDGRPRVGDPTERTGGYFGTLKALPVTLGLNFHPIRRGRFDVYLGPLVGWAFARDAEYDTEFAGVEEVALDDGFAYGAVLGLDAPIGSGRWAFSAALRYLDLDFRQDRVARILLDRFQLPTDDRRPNDLGVDPLSIRIGLARELE